MDRRVKIIATLGPASSSDRVLNRLLQAGADVVRVNLSHGSEDQHRGIVRRVRTLAESLQRQVPVLFDLMGPRYRLGNVPGGTKRLQRGDRVTLGSEASEPVVPVDSPEFLRHLRAGERMLVDDGLIELEILDATPDRVRARVIHGGVIATRKGINLPDSDLPFDISEKDRAGLRLAVEEGVDYVGASYVGCAEDLAALRHALRRAGREIPLIAKLERRRAVERMDEIVEVADAVMVARGDLGVEVPLHFVPVLQKRIVVAGRRFGRPVIVATQMLESMIGHSRPTRAESSDVANAVFDGADALMLSGETAIGDHPVEAVRTMVEIAREAEGYAAERGLGERTTQLEVAQRTAVERGTEIADGSDANGFPRVADAVARAAVETARNFGVRHIIAFSQSGFTARLIARYRPPVSILAFTGDERVARRVQLLWGVRPVHLETQPQRNDEVVPLVERRLKQTQLAQPGDRLIILMGDPIHERPLTNLMRVHQVTS